MSINIIAKNKDYNNLSIEKNTGAVAKKLESDRMQTPISKFPEPVDFEFRNNYEIRRQNDSQSLILLNFLSKVIF